MKFGPRGLRFDEPVFGLFRWRAAFLDKGATLHLQETALVIEGYRMRFGFPILDRFFRRILCEWSTVTIPYSRVGRHTYSTYWPVKALYWIGAAALLGWVYVVTPRSLDPIFLVVLAGFLGVLGWMVHRVFHPRHHLVFLTEGEYWQSVCFRFLSGKRRKEFTQLLQANLGAARRQTARAADVPAPA